MGEKKKRVRLEPDKNGIIKVENGSRQIHWDYYGKGDKEVLILMNGLAMHAQSWASTLGPVIKDFDVLTWDYFGQGDSSCEDEPYYINKFTDYLVKIMDELKIDKGHSMGVSYGGFVSAEMARLHQDRLLTCTLSGILLHYDYNFQLYQDISIDFYESPDPGAYEIYVKFMYERIWGSSFVEKVYGPTMEKMRNGFYERTKGIKYCVKRLTEAQNPYFENIKNNPDAYSVIKVPTLIIAGIEDRAIPLWTQKEIPNIISDTRFIEIPDCGHMTYLEKPDQFWPPLVEFMKAKSTDFKY